MSDKFKFRPKQIIEKLKSSKKLQYIALILVIVLIFLTYFITRPNSKNNEIVLSYNVVSDLENRLEDLLNKVEGAGKVSVVINVSSGIETVIAMKTVTTETANGKNVEETPILVNGETVKLKEVYPEITGVLIVSEGASNISVYRKLQQATSSLLGVNVNKIEILKME